MHHEDALSRMQTAGQIPRLINRYTVREGQRNQIRGGLKDK